MGTSKKEEAVSLKENRKVVRVEYEHESQKARDGGWGWFVVVGCSLMHALLAGTERTFGLVYLEVEEMFGGSAAVTAWIGSVATACRMGLGPISSMMCNRFGCRTTVMIGGCIIFIALSLSAFPPNKIYLIFTWGILFGVGGSMVYTPSLIAVGKNFSKKRAIANGLATAGSGIGQFSIPQIYTACLNSFGYMGSMLILAAMSFNLINSGALYKPMKRQKIIYYEEEEVGTVGEGESENLKSKKVEIEVHVEEHKKSQEKDENVKYNSSKEGENDSIILEDDLKNKNYSSEEESNNVGCCVKICKSGDSDTIFNPELLKDPTFLLYATCIGFVTVSYIPVPTFLPALAIERGYTKENGSMMLSVIGISDMVGRLTCGFCFDCEKIRPHRKYIYCLFPFILGFFICMIPQCYKLSHFIAVCVFYGMSVGLFVSQIASLLADWCGVLKLSSSLGLLMLFRGCGVLVGPVIGGVIKDATVSYQMTFYFLSSIAFLGAAFYIILLVADNACFKERRRPSF